ncbi:MAG: WYL domain-containing protein [Phycisphaerae bacterium]
MKYSRIYRLLRVITLIQSQRGLNARRLAEACGMTVRTAYRDLEMLAAAGVPCHFDEETGGYRIRGDFFMPPVELTLEESLAVLCLAERLGEDDQIPFMAPALRAAAKLRGRLPGAIRELLETVSPHMEIRLARSMPPDAARDVYQTIRVAIARRRALRCSYEAAHGRRGGGQHVGDGHAGRDADGKLPAAGEEIFTFKPYCLFFSKRAWYVIGHHSGRGELRCLKLNRFTRLEQTNVPYAIPDDFSLDSYLGKAWRMIRGDRVYRVELEFDAEFAETVADTHWHDTQEIEEREDGSIVFRCEVAGLDEIVWWVLSMGPHCVVRRPRELAERVHRLARQTADRYGPARGAAQMARGRQPLRAGRSRRIVVTHSTAHAQEFSSRH